MYTYKIVLKNKGLESYIKEILKERKNWKEYKKGKDKKLDFLYTREGDRTKEIYGLRNVLKNNLRREEQNNISYKDFLFKNLSKIKGGKKYLPKTYYFQFGKDSLNKLKDIFFGKKIYIIKPVISSSGKGIERAEKFEDLETYFSKRKVNDIYRTNSYVIQEYIIDPLTFKRKKFHMRSYFLLYKNDVYVTDYSILRTSKENYKKSDFDNNDVHDTHAASTKEYNFFPQNFKNLKKSEKEHIQKQIFDLVRKLSKLVKTDCYEESENCYQIFAMDLMITKKLELKILEVQRAFGHGGMNENELIGKQIKWLIQSSFITVLDTIFPPENPPNTRSHFIKI